MWTKHGHWATCMQASSLNLQHFQLCHIFQVASWTYLLSVSWMWKRVCSQLSTLLNNINNCMTAFSHPVLCVVCGTSLATSFQLLMSAAELALINFCGCGAFYHAVFTRCWTRFIDTHFVSFKVPFMTLPVGWFFSSCMTVKQAVQSAATDITMVHCDWLTGS